MSTACKIKNCVLHTLIYHGHVHEYTSFLMQINIETKIAALLENFISIKIKYTDVIYDSRSWMSDICSLCYFSTNLWSHISYTFQ